MFVAVRSLVDAGVLTDVDGTTGIFDGVVSEILLSLVYTSFV
jgi:hypothetical protein